MKQPLYEETKVRKPVYTEVTIRKPSKYALDMAALKVGGQQQLAKYLGVSQQAVSKWKAENKIPRKRWDDVIALAMGGELM